MLIMKPSMGVYSEALRVWMALELSPVRVGPWWSDGQLEMTLNKAR